MCVFFPEAFQRKLDTVTFHPEFFSADIQKNKGNFLWKHKTIITSNVTNNNEQFPNVICCPVHHQTSVFPKCDLSALTDTIFPAERQQV